MLGRLEVARWLRAGWKLARATAVQHVAVVHRLSDLEAAGGRDSEQVKLARGLLSDSQTKVIFRQPPSELALVRELCRLSEREMAVVAGLPKGSALWKVGNRSFQVEHVLSTWEREITWTDERMVVGQAIRIGLRLDRSSHSGRPRCPTRVVRTAIHLNHPLPAVSPDPHPVHRRQRPMPWARAATADGSAWPKVGPRCISRR